MVPTGAQGPRGPIGPAGASIGTSTNFTVQALNGNFTFEFEEGVLVNTP